MATLHQAIETTRSALKWGGILVGGIFLAAMIYKGGIFVKDLMFPKAPNPPTVKFGMLPKMVFPKTEPSDNFSYSINTITGSLPTFPDRINVYKISHEEPNLLDLNRARGTASSIGINSVDTKISDTVYSWSVFDQYSKKIVIDIVSRNFIYTTDFLSFTPIINSPTLTEQNRLQQEARDFLSKASALKSDLTKTKTSLYKVENNKLVEAKKQSDAQIIRVDFFYSDIDKLPIYSSSPITSPINLLVSNFDSGTVVEANYYNHNITKESATYPIKTAEEAYKELSSGKAYIAADFNPESKNKKIRSVMLAYYLADKRLDFLLPIIVFTDNDGFYAYVPAIRDAWLN